MIDITISGSGVIAEELRDFPAKAQRAIVRALNRGIAAGETLMAREVARDIGLKVSDVKASFKRRDATSSTPEARLAASLQRIPLIKFSAKGPEPTRGRGRGVTYRLGGGRGRVDGAFIATMRSGHRGVFRRKGYTGRSAQGPSASSKRSEGAWSPNLPITELHGPSLGHVFKKYRAQGLARAVEAFETTLDHEISFRKGGGGA